MSLLLALSAVLAAASPAWADGAWYELGTGPSPVNHDSSQSAAAPSLTGVVDHPNNPLYLGWQEAARIEHGGLVDQVRAATLTSTPFETHPWSEVLSPGRFSLNLDPSHAARQLHLAVYAGSLYAAWIENDGTADQIRVEKWDGSQWSDVVGATPLNATHPWDLTLAAVFDPNVGYTLWLAWTQSAGPHRHLFIDEYDGSSWTPIGAGSLNVSPFGVAEHPQVAEASGGTKIWVAWEEDSVVYVRRYAGATHTFTSPTALSNPANAAYRPSLTVSDTNTAVAWYEDAAGSPATEQVIVKSWDGTGWNQLGSYVNRDPSAQARDPSIADVRGALWIAWVEKPVGGSAFELQTAEWSGVVWGSLSEPVNHNVGFDAKTPVLFDSHAICDSCDNSDTPVLVWAETDPAGHDQIRAVAWGVPPANTEPPVMTGLPQNGQTLSCSHGSWTGNPTSFTVLWERGVRGAPPGDPSWHVIHGATGDTYVVQGADDGSSVRCRVVAANDIVAGEAVSNSMGADAGPPFDDGAPPFITGTPVAGNVLRCNPGPIATGFGDPGWHNTPTFTYYWTRDGQVIPGETAATLLLTRYRDAQGNVIDPSGDGDHTISCVVTGHNDIGDSPPVSARGVAVVDGPPIDYMAPYLQVTHDSSGDADPLHETIACLPGSWYEDYGQFTTQWLRNGAPIAGATSATYRPVAADYGRQISCQVTASNPAGSSPPAQSNSILIGLPTGLNDIQFYREGGANPVDPTSIVPITGRYQDAISKYVLDKLNQGIRDATARCQAEIQHSPGSYWPRRPPTTKEINQQIDNDKFSERVRCQILLYAARKVQANVDGAVRFRFRDCKMDPSQLVNENDALCPSIGIEIPSIDPLNPPQQDPALLQALAPVTPVAIYWDIDNNRTTDAVCPGSSPVLRSILDYNRHWDPHVVIVDADGTVHSGDLAFDLTDPGRAPYADGTLRPSQVRVCGTSLDPPPTKQLPCVTGGTIGAIQISDANLCPIDARTLSDADFSQLLSSDLKQYLLRVSEQQLGNSGEATTAAVRASTAAVRADGGPAKTIWVPWSTAPQAASDIPVNRAAHATSNSLVNASSLLVSATFADTAASLSAEGSALSFPSLYLSDALIHSGSTPQHPDWRPFTINQDQQGFAYDQIYVARGPSASQAAADRAADPAAAGDLSGLIPGYSPDSGSMLVNGVDMSALPDASGQPTALLLVPSDVNQALPNVNSMSLVGRNAAESLGLPTDPKAIPLALEGQLKQEFNDQIDAAKTELLNNVNVDDLQRQATHVAQQNAQALLDSIKRQLNLGPFDLAGDISVDANRDGSATILAKAQLPGLTADPGGGSPLRISVTIHADQQGHLHLEGIHMVQPDGEDAYLFGIDLRHLDLTYDNSGLDVKGEMLFPTFGDAGIKVNDFKLGRNPVTGTFSIQRMDLAYEAGVGQGLPLGYGLFITAVRAIIDLQSSTFGAGVTFAIGTSVGAGCPAVGMDTTLQVTMSHPFDMVGDAQAVLDCIPVGTEHFEAKEPGVFTLEGKAGIDAGPISINGQLGAAFDINQGHYQFWLDAGGSIDPIISNAAIHAVLSDRGLAACGDIDVDVPVVDSVVGAITGDKTIHVAGGASVDFINGRPPLNEYEIIKNLSLFTGCDISHYYVLPHPLLGSIRARGAAGTATSFRLAPHTGPSLISIEGVGSAPRIRLTTPSGRVLDFTDATVAGGKRLPSGEWGIVIAGEDRTVVILPRPQAGVWNVQATQGSGAIVRVRRAQILPPVALRVHGGGRGASRILHYRIAPEAGQVVRFTELARGESHVIATIRQGGTGSIHYTAGDALGSRRQVLAEVFQDGQLRQHVIVASYTAPSPPVGTVRNLRVHRQRRAATISWAPARFGHTYYVEVDYGTGERVSLRPRGRALSVLARGVRRGEGLRIKVVAYSPAGRRGPTATARLSGSLMVGAAHKLAPYRPPKLRRKPRRPHR